MAFELYANNASSTLNGGITSGATTLVVASAASFPATGNFRLVIDLEILLVTGVSGTTFTVLRGQEGTTAASHANGAAVTHDLTAAGLQALLSFGNLSDLAANLPAASLPGRLFLPTNGVHIERDSGSVWSAWGPVYAHTLPPAVTGQTTTLTGNGGSISSGATSGIVTSSAGFPTVPFLVQIGSEDIKVTVVSGTTWTLVRAYNGTSAASHSDGATVTLVNWEWVNQGGASLFNGGDFQVLNAPATVGHNLRILKNVSPGTPYTVTAYLDGLMPADNGARFGLCLRESGSGKLTGYEYSADNPTTLRVVYYSSATSPITAAAVIKVPMLYPWLRIKDDGTNRLYSVSRDGQRWLQQYSEGRTTNLTADEYGWYADPISSYTSLDTQLTLCSLTVG